MPDTKLGKTDEHLTAIAGMADGARSDRHPVSAHERWELQQVMTRVRPQDLSAVEIAALLVILRPAHCRVIGGPASRPGLRAVVDAGGEHPVPKLAH